jgi:hypothetical protein
MLNLRQTICMCQYIGDDVYHSIKSNGRLVHFGETVATKILVLAHLEDRARLNPWEQNADVLVPVVGLAPLYLPLFASCDWGHSGRRCRPNCSCFYSFRGSVHQNLRYVSS